MAKIVILYKQLTGNKHEIMIEKEKMLSGEWYDAASDPELLSELYACRDRIYELNRLHPRETATRDILLRSIIGHMGREVTILSPFFCDYGSHISIGDCTYINFNLTVLDEAPVTIGSHVFIGPGCSLLTAVHPLDAQERNKGTEKALPITIGDSVWLGGNVTVLPGVTIGEGAVVGAGSVVTRDVPPRTVVAGNPARIIRWL